MAFHFGKSIKILPGVKLNISSSGISASVGSRNAKLTAHPDGRVTSSVGMLGMYRTSTIRPARSRNPTPVPPAPSPVPPPAPVPPPPPVPLPAPSAPAWERDLLDAERTGRYADVARTHGRAEPTVRILAAVLDGLDQVHRDPVRARELLGWAVAQGTAELHRHRYVAAHLTDRTWPVEIAGGVVAHLRLVDDVALLAVAELHQAAGDLDVAIRTVEQAQPTAPAALSLVELYSEAGRHADVVDLTNDTTNQDDATALLLVLRGRAFRLLGEHIAAQAALGQALRMQARAVPVRHRALWERAQVHVAQGRTAAARGDLETIRAEDPTHPGLADALRELT